jgi:3-oxoacyl-[acyl-carrier protein] reductase
MSPSLLNEQHVLITGASGGIGGAIAEMFIKHGAIVGLQYNRGKGTLQKRLDGLDTKDGQVILLQGDLTATNVCEELVAEFLEKTHGNVAVLVNNAGGIDNYCDFRDLSNEDWDRSMTLNAKAPLWLSRAVWPVMSDQSYGRIINIGTAAVRYGGSPKNLHYIAAKAALEAITTSLAKEGAKSNILVNTIRCGMIQTNMNTEIAGYSDADYQKRAAMVPVGRTGKPEEIASMVTYLASETGSFITGQHLTIAGGD